MLLRISIRAIKASSMVHFVKQLEIYSSSCVDLRCFGWGVMGGGGLSGEPE